MTDKKTFGSFIKAKRTEKNYSQKDLAELLFITEGAVSKWERGISYPDITLLSDICRVLDISERELITASTDTETRRIKQDARKFRIIRSSWITVPTISYCIALLTCFICNLAVNHTLSWFFIVLTALICAYTFIPTVSCFFESGKLLIFAGSTYLSICLLMFTCAVYAGDLSWFVTACIGVLMGYVLVFGPILLSKPWHFLLSFSITFGLTLLMLLNIRLQKVFPLGAAILMTCYGFSCPILCAYICSLRFDGFLKAGICTGFCGALLYAANHIASLLFGPGDNSYQVDFTNWKECTNGNIHLIFLITSLLISAIFCIIGLCRIKKRRKTDL